MLMERMLINMWLLTRRGPSCPGVVNSFGFRRMFAGWLA